MSNINGTKPYGDEDAANRPPEDESDVEEAAMAEDYQQQVEYDELLDDEMPDMTPFGGIQQDIQSQLQSAVTPLEYGATLDTKFQSYDNYVSLFHYILNSDGPVELDLPSVRIDLYRCEDLAC